MVGGDLRKDDRYDRIGNQLLEPNWEEKAPAAGFGHISP
jgi:hypothetical protein